MNSVSTHDLAVDFKRSVKLDKFAWKYALGSVSLRD
jgi:hypothetical protein